MLNSRKKNENKWNKWEKNHSYISYSMKYYCENHFVIMDNLDNPYYSRFGKFSYFLRKLNDKDSYMTILEELIHFYDSCKGYARFITGDPSYINDLKKYISDKNNKILYKINFDDFLYDYTKIHAYTVSNYSLSTLIMRIAMHHLFNEGKIISYGVSFLIIPEENNIQKISFINQGNIFIHCTNCKRICDKIWGTFALCLDCYHTKICNKCGKNTEINIPNGITLPCCDNCSIKNT